MNGKIISISSVKGGVGKTTTLLNLAGIYCELGKRVLIIDMDLFSGGIAVSLNIKNRKDIFMLVDSLANNRFTELGKYVTSYNSNIDVLCAPVDPRDAMKIDSRYIPLVFNAARKEYDVVLVDTSHILNDINLTIMDHSYMSLFVITNDPVDLKNMKSLLSIFSETDKINYLICLNYSRDVQKDYLNMYDIRETIECTPNYTIANSFFIKDIDKYVMKGKIITLEKKINRIYSKEISNMKKMALDLIDNRHIKEVKSDGKKDSD